MLDLVIEGRRRDLGGGLEVGRVLPFARRRMVGPFIFLDHMGPADFRSGEGIDVRPHPHADMEIVTYVREGAITHQDSMGNRGRTEAGDVQVMSAGSGVRHSEYNLEDATTRIFQIWIEPTGHGGRPSWGARPFPKADRSGRFVTLASGIAGDEGALPIRADARVMGATVKAGERITLPLDPARHAYLVPATGAVAVGGVRIDARDGAAITDVERIDIVGLEDAEVVLVDAA